MERNILNIIEMSSVDCQVTRRRKARNWKYEGEDFIVGKQKVYKNIKIKFAV